MPNAYSPDQVKSKLGWSNSFDRDGGYPLDFAAWFGSYEAAQAAAKTAVDVGSTDSKYYYGMQLYVFDGTTAKTYLIQGDKSLKEIGESSTMKFVDSVDDLYRLEDIEIGQQVLVSDDGMIYIFKGGSVSETFTVRKKSGGVGVTRIFPVNAPTIDKITVVRKGKVRRAKLNFIKGMRKEYKVKERN